MIPCLLKIVPIVKNSNPGEQVLRRIYHGVCFIYIIQLRRAERSQQPNSVKQTGWFLLGTLVAGSAPRSMFFREFEPLEKIPDDEEISLWECLKTHRIRYEDIFASTSRCKIPSTSCQTLIFFLWHGAHLSMLFVVAPYIKASAILYRSHCR